MIKKIRTALKLRNLNESWAYIAQETRIDRAQLQGFAAGKRMIGAKNLEILAQYLGLSLVEK